MSVRLTGRQRDFLASYPDEVDVEVTMTDGGALVLVMDEDALAMGCAEVLVPPEGFIDQPTVHLEDWEGGLDRLYDELNPPTVEVAVEDDDDNLQVKGR